eukprot:GSChrysophyteH2.ASY1.ANO1.312.1 assembled CDS
MFKIALTGSIGTGKSTVANQARTLGFPVFDSDAAVHALYSSSSSSSEDALSDNACPTTTTTTSSSYSASIDRQALGRVVLAQPHKLRLLEAIVHPLVRALYI